METESYAVRVHARIKNVTKPLVIKFLTLVAVILWPLFLVLITPFLLYRFIVSKLAKCLDPSLGSMITGVSSIMSAHTPYSKPFNTIVLAIYLDSHFEKSNLISLFIERILSKGLYPELQQRIITRFGFQFWKNVEEFSLEQHFRYFQQEEDGNTNGNEGSDVELNQLELLQLIGRLSKLPFDASRSPWEFVVVKNYRDPYKPSVKSVFLFRAHHCFIDAYSLINLFSKMLTCPPKLGVEPTRRQQLGLGTRSLLFLKYVVSYPYTVLNYALNGDVNPWVEPSAKSASGKINVHESAPIDIITLKELKKRLGVSMTCLLNTIFIGGIQGLMRKRHQIWKEFRLHMPIMLVEDSSDKLENHFVGVSLDIKVFDNSIYDTLRHVDEELRRVLYSSKLSVFRNITKLIGSFPVMLQPNPSKFPGATVLLSNIPGPVAKIEFTGLGHVEELSAVVTPIENLGVMSMAVSYNGLTKFTIAADSAVLAYPGDKEAFSNGVADAMNQLLASGAKVIQFEN